MQPQPFGCEPVEIRGLDGLVAETGKIAPSEIINEDEDDVWPSWLLVGSLRVVKRDRANDDQAGEYFYLHSMS